MVSMRITLPALSRWQLEQAKFIWPMRRKNSRRPSSYFARAPGLSTLMFMRMPSDRLRA
jgi:hypothetical protein